MDMLKMAAITCQENVNICSRHSAVETDIFNITAKLLRLKCITVLKWGLIKKKKQQKNKTYELHC